MVDEAFTGTAVEVIGTLTGVMDRCRMMDGPSNPTFSIPRWGIYCYYIFIISYICICKQSNGRNCSMHVAEFVIKINLVTIFYH
jgi:hypothetical protein